LRPVFARLACLGLATALVWVAGCNKTAGAKIESETTPAQAPTVKTVKPEHKSVLRVIEQPAFIEAYEETPMFAQIMGRVQTVPVDMGDRIKGPRVDKAGKQTEPGQVLAELWVPELEADVRQKKALVAQAAAEVDQASAAVDAAEANIQTAKALMREAEAGRTRAQALYESWQTQYKQQEKLVQSGSLDAQTLEVTGNQFKAADAARQEVEAKVGSAQATARESEAKRNKAKADHAAAKAKVQVAQAEEGRAAALLEYSKIRAPYDGVVTSRNVHTGYYLTGTGVKPLFVVARMDIVRVMVDVPEADAAFISDGVPARIRCQMIKDQDFQGKVTRSSWSLDAKARTLRAEIDLPNPQGKLRPGMYAYVTFKAESPIGFALPAAAVLTQGDQIYCFRVEKDKAIRTPLKIGARNAEEVQVFRKQTKMPSKAGESGVWEDFTGQEEIVASNAASLTDGQTIQRKE
jgi:HlyD family secretion protein